MVGYRFDPELAPRVQDLPRWDLDDIAGARETLARLAGAAPPFDVPESVSVERFRIPGPADHAELDVGVVRPRSANGAVGALVWLHGGGFVMGGIAGDLRTEISMADELGIAVLAVDYRLAPEHPYPAALDDAVAALSWLRGNASALGIDVARICIGGISAGGGIAAAAALRLRDEGWPVPALLVLETPVLDDRLETASMQSFVDTPLWTRANAVASWNAYLGGLTGDEVPTYAAPARERDLTGLPPTYLQVSEFDPMRDEGIAFAQRLLACGVSTELHLFPGTFHGSSGVGAGTAVSERMVRERNGAIARAVARPVE